MTQMIDVVDKSIETVTITIFHNFKKINESLGMLRRDMEDRKVTKLNFNS